MPNKREAENLEDRKNRNWRRRKVEENESKDQKIIILGHYVYTVNIFIYLFSVS